MKVRQRVYFLAMSNVLTPDQISSRLGIPADEFSLRGSKREGPPPIPRQNLWQLHPDTPDNARLDEQFSALLDRLAPVAGAINLLTSAREIDVSVQVVRYLDPGPEDEAILRAREANLPPGLQVLGGQHPLLGFHLDAGQVARLAALGASIDFDEYGDEYE